MAIKSKEGSARLWGGGRVSADEISPQIHPQPLRKGHSIPRDINTGLDFRSQHLDLWEDTWEETHSCHITVMTPSPGGHHLIDCRLSRPTALPPQARADLWPSPLRLSQDFVTAPPLPLLSAAFFLLLHLVLILGALPSTPAVCPSPSTAPSAHYPWTYGILTVGAIGIRILYVRKLRHDKGLQDWPTIFREARLDTGLVTSLPLPD